MQTEVEITVDAGSAGVRVDRFLAQQAAAAEPGSPLLGVSRARLRKLIDSGNVQVDGHAVRPAHRLRLGQRVAVRIPEPKPCKIVPEPMALDVIFEDEHVIAIAKPASLVVHPGAGRDHGTLVHGLLAHCGDLSGIGGELRPGIVHRLDRGTSGVMVAAKHDQAHEGLARQFAARTASKHYVAFVVGVPQPTQATLDTLIGRHPTDRKRFTTRVRSGRRALTTYEVAAARGGAAMLRVTLGTGRTHQIRVHLADRGHPVLADPLYGRGSQHRLIDPDLRSIVGGLGRQALHAERLELSHPVTQARMVLRAPLPPELEPLDRYFRGVEDPQVAGP